MIWKMFRQCIIMYLIQEKKNKAIIFALFFNKYDIINK